MCNVDNLVCKLQCPLQAAPQRESIPIDLDVKMSEITTFTLLPIDHQDNTMKTLHIP